LGQRTGPDCGASEAVEVLISGISAYRATGGTVLTPLTFPILAGAHAELGQFEKAWRSRGDESRGNAKEIWCEAEVHRVAGEIALVSPERGASRAEACFERALAVARQQQAKSWELCTAISMARLCAIRRSLSKLANCSRRSMAGLPKVLTRSI